MNVVGTTLCPLYCSLCRTKIAVIEIEVPEDKEVFDRIMRGDHTEIVCRACLQVEVERNECEALEMEIDFGKKVEGDDL